MRVLCSIVEEHASCVSDCAVGFRAARQPGEITECIRLVLQKAKAWNHPAVVMQADIRKAFDSMRHDTLCETLRQGGVPDLLVAALLQEQSECFMTFVLNEVVSSDEVLLYSAGKQGGVETPSLWVRYLDACIQKALKEYKAQNLGLRFGTDQEDGGSFQLECLYWADDVYLFANNIDECRAMFDILSACISESSLSWKPESLKLLDSTACSVGSEELVWKNGTGTWKVLSCDRMVALGVGLDREGSTEEAVRHRLACFWRTWASVKSSFCDRRIPLKMRLRRFYDTLGRTLLYGAGGWTVSTGTLRSVKRAEKICLCQMSCRGKKEGECAKEYWERIWNFAKGAVFQLGVQDLQMQVCQLYFGWAGHILRLQPDRPIRRIVTWRDNFWLRAHQAMGNKARELMASRGRPTRWEDALEAAFGANWGKLCHDRDVWRRESGVAASRLWGRVCHKAAGIMAVRQRVVHISNRLSYTLPPALCASVAVQVWGDNEQVVRQINGEWACPEGAPYAAQVAEARWCVHALTLHNNIVRPSGGCWFSHFSRTQNALADSLANRALDSGSFQEHKGCKLEPGDVLRVEFDGASRGNPGESACGIALWLYRYTTGMRSLLAIVGIRLGRQTSVCAEFEGALLSLYVCLDWLNLYSVAGSSQSSDFAPRVLDRRTRVD
jgi:ribonuclease HI